MNKILNFFLGIAIVAISSINLFASDEGDNAPNKNQTGKYKIVAYVVPFRDTVPDPALVTNIFYSQCYLDSALRGVVIQDTACLRKITILKEKAPELKISLCIQDDPNRVEGFCEMTSSPERRRDFALDCKKKIEEFGLDGIDLDWEFPGTTATGHNATEEDAKNYALLAAELRRNLGDDKLITFYSNNSAKYIDFDAMLPYVDYVMVSGYNLGLPPARHQSNLYSSTVCGEWCVASSVKRHIELGVPPEKLMLGVPFYARTISSLGRTYLERPNFDKYLGKYTIKWDNEAKVPYYSDDEGNIMASYDNPESIRIKGNFIKDNGLAGVFYWHYGSDDSNHTMARSVKNAVKDDEL